MTEPTCARDAAERRRGRRVLSIQSHVVHGYVGNKCAAFPLQLLGFHVDPINSVQFSNHTGYCTFRGAVLQGDELLNLIEGLKENDLLGGYSHVLTGYIGSSSFLEAVVRTLRTLREANPAIEYYCDPVMGDNDELYVPQELVAIYRETVVPLATVSLTALHVLPHSSHDPFFTHTCDTCFVGTHSEPVRSRAAHRVQDNR